MSAPRSSTYIVARCILSNRLRWFSEFDELPATLCEVRIASDAEAELMRRIADYRDPSARWVKELGALMERHHAAWLVECLAERRRCR